MANAVRVENLSKAEQELAPGSGFIPVGGSVDYPIATYKDKHERYARARLEADPPILKATEVDSPDVDKLAQSEAQRAEDAERAAVARQAELGKKVEETVLKTSSHPAGAEEGTKGVFGTSASTARGGDDDKGRRGR